LAKLPLETLPSLSSGSLHPEEATWAYTKIAVAGSVLVMGAIIYGIVYDASNDFNFLTTNTPLLDIPNYATLLLGLFVAVAATYTVQKYLRNDEQAIALPSVSLIK